MSRRDVRAAIRDMVSHAEDARAFASDLPWEKVVADKMRRFAILRALEVVGEAATRVPDEVRMRAPEIPWTAIIGLRNRLIHGYDSVDEERLGRIVLEQVPTLIRDLKGMLEGSP